jgi:hypothetical protein
MMGVRLSCVPRGGCADAGDEAEACTWPDNASWFVITIWLSLTSNYSGVCIHVCMRVLGCSRTGGWPSLAKQFAMNIAFVHVHGLDSHML